MARVSDYWRVLLIRRDLVEGILVREVWLDLAAWVVKESP